MFVNDCVGNIVHEQIDKMKSGEVLLLENLRFHKERSAMIWNFHDNFRIFLLIFM